MLQPSAVTSVNPCFVGTGRAFAENSGNRHRAAFYTTSLRNGVCCEGSSSTASARPPATYRQSATYCNSTAMDVTAANSPDGQRASADGSPTAQSPIKKTSSREKSEREKRTYRACLHCRQRKSRCDLSAFAIDIYIYMCTLDLTPEQVQ